MLKHGVNEHEKTWASAPWVFFEEANEKRGFLFRRTFDQNAKTSLPNSCGDKTYKG